MEPEGIRFAPTFLPEEEWTTEPTIWTVRDPVDGTVRDLEIPANGLGFQCLGVPVVMRREDGATRIQVQRTDGATEIFPGDRLDPGTSQRLIQRDGTISLIQISLEG